MSFIIVAIAAILVSALTMFSGFGLGTLLMPVFAIFFPVESAVAATAIVHGANNIMKAAMLGRKADWGVVRSFGFPALAASFAGAGLLGLVAHFKTLYAYEIFGLEAVVTPIKLLMGLLMVFFAVFELLPSLSGLTFDRKYLPLGGLLSGFFGGLSGHQGALRSAFLTKTGLDTQSFVGSNAIIGLMVDMARLLVYGAVFIGVDHAVILKSESSALILTGVVAAFAGVFAGKRLMKKITMSLVQKLTGVLLLLIAVLLSSGII